MPPRAWEALSGRPSTDDDVAQRHGNRPMVTVGDRCEPMLGARRGHGRRGRGVAPLWRTGLVCWSGCLADGLLVGRGLELIGRQVAQRAVEPGAVVPGDVVDGGAAGGGPGWPGLGVQALAL